MTTLPSNPRYERKFVADGFTLPEVLALVRRHPAAFREVYPARSVNNLYLDSPEFSDYHDHVNGVAHRNKTRIRWYGAWSGRLDAPEGVVARANHPAVIGVRKAEGQFGAVKTAGIRSAAAAWTGTRSMMNSWSSKLFKPKAGGADNSTEKAAPRR